MPAGMALALAQFTDELLRRGIEQSGGLVPIDYLMSVMGNERAPREVRIQVAGMLLPYYHRRQAIMAEIDMRGNGAIMEQLELVYGVINAETRELDSDGSAMGSDDSAVHSVQ